jgi:hypothetical protein
VDATSIPFELCDPGFSGAFELCEPGSPGGPELCELALFDSLEFSDSEPELSWLCALGGTELGT